MFDALPINVADPKVFIGLLIGGAVPFLFSALAINAVSRTAGVVVQEVRRQFADGQIMKGDKQPDHGPVIDICTAASLRELTTPALLAVLTPVIVGFGIGFTALGAFLVAVILVGQLMANYLSNAGGAWDNAKKYIEDGNEGGKGSDSYRAAVIADTVGDPFKDTAGPALNPLIKVMNLVSLLILPAILSDSLVDKKTDGILGTVTADPTGKARLIALGALVILVGRRRHLQAAQRRLRRRDPHRGCCLAAAVDTSVSEAVEAVLDERCPDGPRVGGRQEGSRQEGSGQAGRRQEGGSGQEGSRQEGRPAQAGVGPSGSGPSSCAYEAPAPAGASSRAVSVALRRVQEGGPFAAAVQHQVRPADVRGQRAGEEDHCVGDVGRRREAAQRARWRRPARGRPGRRTTRGCRRWRRGRRCRRSPAPWAPTRPPGSW